MFKDLGLSVTTDFTNGGMHVHNLSAPGLPFLRTLGTKGTGATVGATAQFVLNCWMTPAPWSNSRLLVPDNFIGRVVEVDVVTGLLVKVRRLQLLVLAMVLTLLARRQLFACANHLLVHALA